MDESMPLSMPQIPPDLQPKPASLTSSAATFDLAPLPDHLLSDTLVPSAHEDASLAKPASMSGHLPVTWWPPEIGVSESDPAYSAACARQLMSLNRRDPDAGASQLAPENLELLDFLDEV